MGWNGYDDTSGNGSGNGTDDYGFSALPGGYREFGRFNNDVGFSSVGNYGYFWSATEAAGPLLAYFRSMHYDVLEYYSDEGNGYSVRCVAR